VAPSEIIDAEFTVVSPAALPSPRKRFSWRKLWYGRERPEGLEHLTDEEFRAWLKLPFWTKHRLNWRRGWGMMWRQALISGAIALAAALGRLTHHL
jgi:hypothetical protein